MEKDWVIAYESKQEYLADIARAVLSDNDIESVIINKKDSIYNSFGDIEVYVNRDNLIRAKQVLQKL
jgi:formylmethanofuran dehydrogenase subunit D